MNHFPRYDGHHFRWRNISNIMRAGDLPNQIITTETLNISMYSNIRVETINPKTNKVINTYYIGDVISVGEASLLED